jgi:hypothetical protein
MAQPQFKPVREIVVSNDWCRITGGREMFGAVTIRVVPADEFALEIALKWPDGSRAIDYTNAVLDGILDCLFVDVGASLGKARFRLEAIEWRDDSSVPFAYYRATRECVREIFGLNEKGKLGDGPNAL